MHLANDLALGITFRESKAMSFFLLEGLGLLIESCMQAAWQKLVRKDTGKLEKVAGYLWITLYLSWTGARWIYPANRVLTKEGSLLKWDFAYPIFVDTRV